MSFSTFSLQPTCSGIISTLHPSAKYGNKKKKKRRKTKPMASCCRRNRKPLGHSYRGPAFLFGQMCYHAFNATPTHTVTPPKQRNKKKPVHPSCGVTYRTLTPSCPNITDPKQSTKHREPAQSHHYRQLGTPGGRAVKLGEQTRDTWRSPR